MKFIVFNNNKVDTGLFLQLQDLASVLTEIENLKFDFSYGHYVDVDHHTITASHFWDHYPWIEMTAGYKTDLFLRAIGTLQYTDSTEMLRYLNQVEGSQLKRFSKQLFTLFEDLRLEERCKQERPGTSRYFSIRNQVFQKYFESQLRVNTNRGYRLDTLFCMIYLTLYSSAPDPLLVEPEEQQLRHLEQIKPLLYEAFETISTKQVANIAEKIVFGLTSLYEEDSLNEYFVMPIYSVSLSQEGVTLDDLKRKSKLNSEKQGHQSLRSDEGKKEKLLTWHSERKEEDGDRSLLNFSLDRGTSVELRLDSARETGDDDQATGTVQGRSNKSIGKDYSEQEARTQEAVQQGENSEKNKYGVENKDAVAINKYPDSPGPEDRHRYFNYVEEVDRLIYKLYKTIDKTLEHKKLDPRKDLRFGRLSKKLIPLIIDDFPRIFYKKNHEAKEIDACFTLLVDCSASMFDKMEETKKGIILFHEVLKRLKIPHSIIGFWEDANHVKEGFQPNYFHRIKEFQTSVFSKTGAEIMQLEPQEDNRDGFSIRVVTEDLQRRVEKHKFLLVFSDGEPAAYSYDQNGIIDTKEAVTTARKKGIEVIGLFLANGEIAEESENMMSNIYNKEYLLVPHVKQLPDLFAPLLKKLLIKSI